MSIAKEKCVLNTKYGRARINKGYYVIKTSKEGNHNKPLHRVIFEDFYGFEIPEGYVIHHKDGNKLNNCILNLKLMSKLEHLKLHFSGKNNPNYGKKFSEEDRKRMSEIQKGIKRSEEYASSVQKITNTSGFCRISKKPCKTCVNGFSWCYQYYDENVKHISITSVNLITLRRKIIEKGLKWEIVNEKTAKKTCEEFGYNLEELR